MTAETLVLAAHGSLRDGRSASPVYAHADRLRARGAVDVVRVAFWKQEPSLRAVARSLDGKPATVVPMLSSAGYFAEEVFPAELGVHDVGETELRYTEPVGTHPAMTDVVAARVAAATESPAQSTVVVVSHGTERNPNSAKSAQRHAKRLRDRGDYAAVLTAYLDESPAIGDVLDRVETRVVVVVPLFLADGHHTAEDVPAALGHSGIGQTTEINGHIVHYTGAVGTEPTTADVVVERAREAGTPVESTGSTVGVGKAERGLASLLRSGQAPRTWGELCILSKSDGFRLCHRADTHRPAAELESVPTLAALRTKIRRDDNGLYRPLTGERSLPQGWSLDVNDPVLAARAIEVVYPGAVFAWDRHRRSALDPTPLSTTVDRQRGMYTDLETLDETERRAATAAICGDCVRDRTWSIGDETDPGDGVQIPCEEACPFFLAAAHGLAEHGPAAANTADPNVHAAEFEDPANRVRVRYARALAESAAIARGIE